MTWRRGISSFFLKTEYRTAALLLAFVLTLSAASYPVSAVGTVITPISDEEIVHNEEEVTDEDFEDEESESESGGFDAYVTISDTVQYYPSREVYIKSFGSAADATVTSNVTSGMFTNEPVSLTLGSNIKGVLYRNGQEDDQNLLEITLPGNYVMRMADLNGNDLGSFTFRITDKYTNTSVYAIPEGFYVYEVLRGGKHMDTASDRVSLDKEGEYLITIRNDRIDKYYVYEAIVDHTAPVLALKELNENNAAKSQVDISDLEPGVDMVITCDGKPISTRNTLTMPGRYQIVLTDPAGNVTIYQFVIYLYLTVSGTLVLVILGGLYLGLMVYLFISRKNLRVR